MKSVVKLLGVVVLFVPMFAYALGERVFGSVEFSPFVVESFWNMTEMYGSVVLFVVGLLSLRVARKRQKTLSA
ncbi:hypothetical protein A9Q99_13480 [Gammaproteobacteria bacterium 45_16_T64]|nr:hypothetical protein A9Q99_13480 [Gammaproteobacteria bacterium 45_16_T64]